jgi:hypothetical protein
LDEEFQKELFDRAERNREIARGLGMGLGRIFKYLSTRFQKELFDRSKKISGFAYGLGFGL